MSVLNRDNRCDVKMQLLRDALEVRMGDLAEFPRFDGKGHKPLIT